MLMCDTTSSSGVCVDFSDPQNQPRHCTTNGLPASPKKHSVMALVMQAKYHCRRQRWLQLLPIPESTWIPPLLHRPEVRRTLKTSCVILTSLFLLSFCLAWLLESPNDPPVVTVVFPTEPPATPPPTVEPEERADGLSYCETLRVRDVAHGTNGTCGTYDRSEGVVCWRYEIFMRTPIVTRHRGPWSIHHVAFPYDCDALRVAVLSWSDIDVMYRDVHDHAHKFTGLRMESCLQALIHAVSAPDYASLCHPKYSPGDLMALRETEP